MGQSFEVFLRLKKLTSGAKAPALEIRDGTAEAVPYRVEVSQLTLGAKSPALEIRDGTAEAVPYRVEVDDTHFMIWFRDLWVKTA